MEDRLIKEIKQNIKQTEKTRIYDNLYKYAYSKDQYIRFLFMNILISNSNLDLKELYEDDISRYFQNYDEYDHTSNLMPYECVKILADNILRKRKDLKSYRNILLFIINNYFEAPEVFRERVLSENKSINL